MRPVFVEVEGDDAARRDADRGPRRPVDPRGRPLAAHRRRVDAVEVQQREQPDQVGQLAAGQPQLGVVEAGEVTRAGPRRRDGKTARPQVADLLAPQREPQDRPGLVVDHLDDGVAGGGQVVHGRREHDAREPRLRPTAACRWPTIVVQDVAGGRVASRREDVGVDHDEDRLGARALLQVAEQGVAGGASPAQPACAWIACGVLRVRQPLRPLPLRIAPVVDEDPDAEVGRAVVNGGLAHEAPGEGEALKAVADDPDHATVPHLEDRRNRSEHVRLPASRQVGRERRGGPAERRLPVDVGDARRQCEEVVAEATPLPQPGAGQRGPAQHLGGIGIRGPQVRTVGGRGGADLLTHRRDVELGPVGFARRVRHGERIGGRRRPRPRRPVERHAAAGADAVLGMVAVPVVDGRAQGERQRADLDHRLGGQRHRPPQRQRNAVDDGPVAAAEIGQVRLPVRIESEDALGPGDGVVPQPDGAVRAAPDRRVPWPQAEAAARFRARHDDELEPVRRLGPEARADRRHGDTGPGRNRRVADGARRRIGAAVDRDRVHHPTLDRCHHIAEGRVRAFGVDEELLLPRERAVDDLHVAARPAVPSPRFGSSFTSKGRLGHARGWSRARYGVVAFRVRTL